LSPTELFLIEPYDCGANSGLYVGNSLLQTTSNDKAQVVITNTTPLPQKLSKGCWIGQTGGVNVITQDDGSQGVQQGMENTPADVMS